LNQFQLKVFAGIRTQSIYFGIQAISEQEIVPGFRQIFSWRHATLALDP